MIVPGVYAIWSGEENEECNEEQENVSAQGLLRRDLNLNVVSRNQTNPFYFVSPEAICFDPAGADCITLHGLPGLPHKNNYWGSLINSNDITMQDNLYDYLLFLNRSTYSNYSECLSRDEMNFYYESMEDLALEMLPDPPGTRGPVLLEVGWDRLTTPSLTVIWHPMNAMAADKVSTDVSNAIPLPDDSH